MGARAFAESDPAADDVGMVLNFEARGSRGPSILFETGPGTGAPLLRRFAASAPHPLAYSYTYDVYQRLPNDTDFSVFRRRNLPGFNFAFIDGFDQYHSPGDDLRHLDRGSLQHHGEYALALARELGGAEAGELGGGPPATYFRLPALGLAVYPTAWALPLALLALAAMIAVLVLALRRRAATWGGLALGLVAALAGTVAGVAVAVLLHRLLPRLLGTAGGALATSDLYLCALLIAGTGAAWWVLAAVARRSGMVAVAAGALILWAVAAVATAVLLPSSAYLFAWPALFAAAALLVASPPPDRRDGTLRRWQVVVLAALAVPALLLWLPTFELVLTALGTGAVVGVAALCALLVALCAPSLEVLLGRRRVLGALVLAAGVILAVGGAATTGYGADNPRPDSLFYAFDADRGTAAWASFDVRPDAWTSALLDGDRRRLLTPFFARDPGRLLAGDAPPVELPSSLVELAAANDGGAAAGDGAPAGEGVASEEGGAAEEAAGSEDGARRIELHVVPAPGTALVTLRLASEARLESVHLLGKAVPLAETDGSTAGDAAEELGDEGRADLAIDLWAPPAEGFDLIVELAADRPLGVAVIDRHYGLPAVDGIRRPDDTVPGRYGTSDVTLVKREYRF